MIHTAKIAVWCCAPGCENELELELNEALGVFPSDIQNAILCLTNRQNQRLSAKFTAPQRMNTGFNTRRGFDQDRVDP